jgi:hypothetical protein
MHKGALSGAHKLYFQSALSLSVSHRACELKRGQTKTQTVKEITLPYLPVNPCIGLLCVFFLLLHVLFSTRFGRIETLLFLLAWTTL